MKFKNTKMSQNNRALILFSLQTIAYMNFTGNNLYNNLKDQVKVTLILLLKHLVGLR